MLLFGSRARANAGPDSDFDVAVLLSRNDLNKTEVRSQICDAAFEHIIDGFGLNPLALPDDYLDPVDGHYRTELARRISEEGLDI